MPGFATLPPRAGSSRPEIGRTEDTSPLQTVLFGSVLPKRLDLTQFPQLAEQMRWLMKQKTKLAAFVGDSAGDYDIALAEGESACVDKEGTVFIGEKLVRRAEKDPALLIGVLAHEIGHRPKTWKR